MTLRNYKENTPEYKLYYENHIYQTHDYVVSMMKKYNKRGTYKLSMKDALKMMDEFIDPSDPDLDLPNSIHAYQTADRIRKQHPYNYELQIIGLIHDLGKILFKFGEPNWAIVGDTFVVGAKPSNKCVYYDAFKENTDMKNPKYNTTLGIYKQNCGIENLKLSFGHDEYLYYVLINNQHKLSKQFLKIIRYHSFYPWHTGNDYKYFMNSNLGDDALLKDILDFNNYDLYSKEDTTSISEETKEYYDKLLDDFFPNDLFW